MQRFYTGSPLYKPSLAFPFLGSRSTAKSSMATLIPIQAHTDSQLIDQQREHYESQSWRDDARAVITSLWWTDDGVDTSAWIHAQLDRYSWIRHPVVYLHTNTALPDSYDMLWNRHKRYFTSWTRELRKLHWTQGFDGRMYVLNPIPRQKTSTRLYLSPTRIYPQHLKNGSTRMQYRSRLLTRLQRHSGIHTGQDIILPQQQTAKGVEQIRSLSGSIWQPCHNRYYESTYFSAYVETLTGAGNTRTVTEKTFDPLVKGHFILPFAYKGMIEDLVAWGFQVPDFIDYTYNTLDTEQDRWRAYIEELERLMHIDWPRYYAQYQPVLEHNRTVFWTRPYSVWDK